MNPDLNETMLYDKTGELLLNVSEIFYSLQGEGARAGTPTVFIRLQGCKAKFACAKQGVVCDTEFESGGAMTLLEIGLWMGENAPGCNEITWTGGEPLDQLTAQHLRYFKEHDYYQAVETSGLHPLIDGFDFVCLSPKVAEHILAKNFPNGVTELRYVRHKGQQIPQPSVVAQHYWLSPHSDGWAINATNVMHCVELCLKNPRWKLSVQQHKMWSVL